MQDRKIETLNFLVVTDAAFIEDALVLKNVSLPGSALAKAVEDGFGNRTLTITDCIDAAVPFAGNLVAIGTVAKVQPGMDLENLTTFDRCQRATHRVCQTLCS